MVYEFGGGRFYLSFMDMIGRTTGERRIILENEIFGDGSDGSFGGIIMSMFGNRILILGRNGFRLYRSLDNKTKFYFYDMCSLKNLNNAEAGINTVQAQESYKNMAAWRKKAHSGTFVQFRVDKGRSSLMDDIWGYGAWYFKGGSLKQQCDI